MSEKIMSTIAWHRLNEMPQKQEKILGKVLYKALFPEFFIFMTAVKKLQCGMFYDASTL